MFRKFSFYKFADIFRFFGEFFKKQKISEQWRIQYVNEHFVILFLITNCWFTCCILQCLEFFHIFMLPKRMSVRQIRARRKFQTLKNTACKSTICSTVFFRGSKFFVNTNSPIISDSLANLYKQKFLKPWRIHYVNEHFVI